MPSLGPDPAPIRTGPVGRLPTIGFAVLLAVLVLLRLPHLTGPIEEPHAWRQCDTAQFARNFTRRGFDLLHPAVNWMGGHRTLALEFPLPEALMAAVYRVAGPGEDRARLLTLVVFTTCTWYFFLLARRLCGPWTALWSAGVYAVLPLSWFYSRAVLIDYYVLAFAHAWAYHWLRAADDRSTRHLLLGAAALGLGALIKPQALLPIGVPMLAVAAFRARRELPKFVAAGLAALVPFFLWHWHAEHLNRAIPDWSFLPNFIKFAGPELSGWYFGTLFAPGAQMFWTVLGQRLWGEVMTPPGLMLFLVGAAAMWLRRRARPEAGSAALFLSWLVGSLLYLLLFFGLNVGHNYYQLPLLGPAALGIGAGLELLRQWRIRTSPVPGRVAALLAFCLLAGYGWRFAETHYYRPSWELISAGRELQARTPPDALVVVSQELTDVRDPRVLYYADREGWSVPLPALSPGILKALRKEGAEYLAILGTAPPPDPSFLPSAPQEVPLAVPPWRMWVYRLRE